LSPSKYLSFNKSVRDHNIKILAIVLRKKINIIQIMKHSSSITPFGPFTMALANMRGPFQTHPHSMLLGFIATA
jgi:hypothetical protein